MAKVTLDPIRQPVVATEMPALAPGVAELRVEGSGTAAPRRDAVTDDFSAAAQPATLKLNPVIPPAVQQQTLDAVFARINEVARAGGKPVVEIDLDLTGLMPTERTHEALRQLGQRYNVPEFATPEKLAVIPGYTTEAWRNFLDQSGFGAKYPALQSVGSLDSSYYWNESLIANDAVTPGLAQFVQKVKSLGGTVVFNSGRWQPDAREKAVAALQRGGVTDYELLIGNAGYSDAQNKQVREQEIREKFGTVVAIFDDRQSNRNAMVGAAGSKPAQRGDRDPRLQLRARRADGAVPRVDVRGRGATRGDLAGARRGAAGPQRSVGGADPARPAAVGERSARRAEAEPRGLAARDLSPDFKEISLWRRRR